MQIDNSGQAQSPTEEMGFQLHPNLLRHIIGRQAPSLAKAVLEVAMNAVDGGAAKLTLDLSERGLVAVDDGRGFGTDPDEIKRVFGTFGEPHAEEDVPLGEFRMGRGQLFAQGKTTYESGAFRFDVDLRGRGQSWRLETGRPYQPGCRITVEFPEPRMVEPSSDEIKELVAWLPIAIHLNGELISQPPASAEWDLETDDAWFKMGQGPLKVYNRGAFVHAYPAETWGIGGVVVSKARLAVTFGRNEVMRDCAVFKRIVANLDDLFLAGLRARKTKSMPAQMRARALKMLSVGKLHVDDLIQYWLLRDARGRPQSLQVLTRYSAVAMGPLGDPHAFRAIETGKALVLDDEYFEGSGVDLPRLLVVMKRDGYPVPAQLSWEQILADIKLGRNTLPERDLPPHERALLFGAQVASRAVAALIEEMDLAGGVVPTRRVIAAARDSEDVFSDGESFIALSLRHLEDLSKGEFSFVKAAALLASAYIRFPAPGVGDSIEEGSMEAAIRESAVADGIFHLVSSHIDPVAVSRSPLSGDPMVFSRWWNSKAKVRDLGDVGRLWAEDYARRCPGWGVVPKESLLRAVGIRQDSLIRDLAGDEAQTEDPEYWWETFSVRLQPALSAWALSHWSFALSEDRKKVIARRGKPRKPAFLKESPYRSGHRLYSVFGPYIAAGLEKTMARWAEERPFAPPAGAIPPSFSIGTAKKRPKMEDLITIILDSLIRVEFSLGGFEVSGWREFGKKHIDVDMLQSWSSRAKSVQIYRWKGREQIPAGVGPVFRKKIPSLRMLEMVNSDVYGRGLLLTITGTCGRDEADKFSYQDGHSRQYPLHGWTIRRLGWPIMTLLLRRYTQILGGEQVLFDRLRGPHRNREKKSHHRLIDDAEMFEEANVEQ